MPSSSLFLGRAFSISDASASFPSGSRLNLASGSITSLNGTFNLGGTSVTTLASGAAATIASGATLTLASGSTTIVNGSITMSGTTRVATNLSDASGVVNMQTLNNAIAALVDSADLCGNTLGKLQTLNNLLLAEEIKDVSDIIVTIAANAASAATALSNEQSRAEAAELKLRTDLSGEIVRATNRETDISSNLATEASRATAAELQLRTDLSGEIVRATNRETDISSNLATEASRATAAELKLRTDLSGEIVRASNAEAVLTQNAAWTNLVPCNAAVFADECAPTVIPTALVPYVPDGWYFKNPRDNSKVNWYLPSFNLTMSDIEYVAFAYFPIASAKNVSMPYFTIYTKMGSNIKKYTTETYTRPSPYTYNYVYANVSGSSTLTVPKIPGYTSTEMTSVGGNADVSPWGSWTANEQVYYFGFFAGTSTDCSAGDVEMVLKEVNIITKNSGTISNKYSNDSVINYYTAKQVSALYAYFFDTSSNIVGPPETDHSAYLPDPTGAIAKIYGSSQVPATYYAI